MKILLLLPFLVSFSFSTSKKHLKKFYKDKNTYYCNCKIKGLSPQLNSCGYKHDKYWKRSFRLEFEHVVPASILGGNTTSWKHGHKDCKKKGRACAEKVNYRVRKATSDLINLVPVLGSLNAIRSNYEMNELTGERRAFGKCDFELNKHMRMVEPPNNKKGDIARIYLYMATAYSDLFTLSDRQKKTYSKWDNDDPISKEECKKDKWAYSIQGFSNSKIKYSYVCSK